MIRKNIFTILVTLTLLLLMGVTNVNAITYEAPEGYSNPITYTYNLSDGLNESIVLYPGDTLKIEREIPADGTSQYVVGIISNPSYVTETSKYYTDAVYITENYATAYQSIKIKGAYSVEVHIGEYSCGAIDSPNPTNENWRKRAVGFNITQLSSYYLNLTYTLTPGVQIIQGEDTNPTKIYVPRSGDNTFITLKSPVKEGLKFRDWQINNGAAYNSNGIYVKDLVLDEVGNFANPIFIESDGANHYYGTVKLDVNNGAIDGLSSKIYEIEFDKLNAFNLSSYNPVKKGFTFAGWYSDSELTTKVDSLSELSSTFYSSVSSENRKTTLYAKWTQNATITTYTITINSGNGFTTNPTSPISVNKNGNQDITITADSGYKLSSVKVDGVEQILPLTNNKIVLTNITKDMTILIEVQKIIYNFDLNSKNVTYTIGTNTELSLRVEDATLDNFDKVYINNKLLDSKYYTLLSGSIIVKLNDSYLQTLKNGTYNVRITTNDGGKAETTFVIANSSVKDEENPKTGDNIVFSIIIGIVSILGIVGCIVFIKKNL